MNLLFFFFFFSKINFVLIGIAIQKDQSDHFSKVVKQSVAYSPREVWCELKSSRFVRSKNEKPQYLKFQCVFWRKHMIDVCFVNSFVNSLHTICIRGHSWKEFWVIFLNEFLGFLNNFLQERKFRI